MTFDNRYIYDVDGATNFEKEGDGRVRLAKFYRQVVIVYSYVLPTSQKPM